MQTEATELLWADGAVHGVRARGPQGEVEVRGRLVVSADGRSSELREQAGCARGRSACRSTWYGSASRSPGSRRRTPSPTCGAGGMVVTIERDEYLQVGLIIPKGGFAALQDAGLEEFRRTVAGPAPHLRSVLETITEWDQLKLLSVQIDRLPRWYRRGYLAIGDAAHAMSPAFGVGVNYAVQDAVATANALAATLRDPAAGEVDLRLLDGIQRRRMPPVAGMQRIQLAAHRFISWPEGVRLLPDPLPAPLRLAVVGPARPQCSRSPRG
ncbi:FAD-dependent monooxygenase [Leifsonia sp. L25]|uniref:FAD-dependent monooxygenase n=1 Tax=Leifsonia sp. L25 TaxID=3423957 RepID=UPI003D6963E7